MTTGGTTLPELETPALLIDLDALEANLAEMAAVAARAGVGLRPHTKTRKSPQIARMQVEAGAAGDPPRHLRPQRRGPQGAGGAGIPHHRSWNGPLTGSGRVAQGSGRPPARPVAVVVILC